MNKDFQLHHKDALIASQKQQLRSLGVEEAVDVTHHGTDEDAALASGALCVREDERPQVA